MSTILRARGRRVTVVGASGGDEIDKRWLAAVAEYDKRYQAMSSGWRRLVTPGADAWLDGARRTFDQAKDDYARGFAGNDDKQRSEAIALLEKLVGVIDEYGSAGPTGDAMPTWLKVTLIGGGIAAGVGVLAAIFMPIFVAKIEAGPRRGRPRRR